MSDFEKDSDGNIVLRPIIGWAYGSMAETGILLQIHYIDSLAELGSAGKTIQFGILPQQCLELAEKLTTLAKRMLKPSDTPLN